MRRWRWTKKRSRRSCGRRSRNTPIQACAAAEWLLRKWQRLEQRPRTPEELVKERNAQLERIGAALAKNGKEPRWYVNSQGQTMVVIAGPVHFEMGTPATEADREGGATGRTEMLHAKHIGRSFAIAAKEVTVAEFLRFRAEHAYNKQYAPTEAHPVNLVTWYDAAAYCNWLSDQEGIAERQWCYEANPKGKFAEGMKLRPNYLQLAGYRLPTEAEWECACRAGSGTSRYYGDTEELLGKYAWYTKNSNQVLRLPGSLKPNDWGLFDMLGNALEWCHDSIVNYAPGDDKENIFDAKQVGESPIRVLRGGSFVFPAVYVRCGFRYWLAPGFLVNRAGFRPARTFIP